MIEEGILMVLKNYWEVVEGIGRIFVRDHRR
jgi:hypothetical protein